MNLDTRKKIILSAVIDAYIRTGEPVGSKVLSELNSLNVSSATIRNEMSELEKMGYLHKPHTSAGRIPSNEGYRYYVQTSLNPYKLTAADKSLLGQLPRDCAGLHQTVNSAADRLAQFLGLAVFAVAPSCSSGVFTFEVLPVGKRSYAVLAISAVGNVKTVFARSDGEVSPAQARKFAAVLNEILSGFPVEQIGRVRLILLANETARVCPECSCLLNAVTQLIEQLKSYELTVCGGENLLSYPEFSNIGAAREYIALLSKHERIMDVLLTDSQAGQLTIRIGDENHVFQNSYASMISMLSDAKIPVAIGVMGPTRMNYAKAAAGFLYLMNQLKTLINEEY